MLCKVIATPAKVGKGAFNGWDFEPDDGRVLEAYQVRFTYNPHCQDRIKAILTDAMKAYRADQKLYWEKHKASKKALEYTQAMRAWKSEREKFIREGRTLKYESL